jgi:hypothetical protein
MTNLIKIPKRFFDDHRDRDLDTPEVVKSNQNHYWISKSDFAIKELIDDAEYYVKMGELGAWDKWMFGLVGSAKATLKSLKS